MPDNHDLDVGDRVKVKHSSRVMTVEEVYEPIYQYRYRCSWMAFEGVTQSEVFRREQLEKIVTLR